MELCGNRKELFGIPMELYGNPMELYGNPMELYGNPVARRRSLNTNVPPLAHPQGVLEGDRQGDRQKTLQSVTFSVTCSTDIDSVGVLNWGTHAVTCCHAVIGITPKLFESVYSGCLSQKLPQCAPREPFLGNYPRLKIMH